MIYEAAVIVKVQTEVCTSTQECKFLQSKNYTDQVVELSASLTPIIKERLGSPYLTPLDHDCGLLVAKRTISLQGNDSIKRKDHNLHKIR